jgi:hypothetical protein
VGLEELLEAMAAGPARTRGKADSRDFLRLAQEAVAVRFVEAQATAEVQELFAAWQRGDLNDSAAGAAILRILSQRSPSGRG